MSRPRTTAVKCRRCPKPRENGSYCRECKNAMQRERYIRDAGPGYKPKSPRGRTKENGKLCLRCRLQPQLALRTICIECRSKEDSEKHKLRNPASRNWVERNDCNCGNRECSGLSCESIRYGTAS